LQRRAIIVHDLEAARAAVAAAAALGLPVALRSASGGATSLGAPLFREIVAAAGADHPEADVVAVLDCGCDPGYALAALRSGIRWVRVELPAPVLAAVADIARQHGGRIDTATEPALDLLDCQNPLAACKKWLRNGRE
jgi:hypothetical protein